MVDSRLVSKQTAGPGSKKLNTTIGKSASPRPSPQSTLEEQRVQQHTSPVDAIANSTAQKLLSATIHLPARVSTPNTGSRPSTTEQRAPTGYTKGTLGDRRMSAPLNEPRTLLNSGPRNEYDSGEKLFDMVAKTPTGGKCRGGTRTKSTVSFGDFAQLHQNLLATGVEHFGDANIAAKKLGLDTPVEMEKQFRSLDTDGSLGLDSAEWSTYAAGLQRAFGSEWTSVCDGLMQQHAKQAKEYDAFASGSLLDKIRAAQHLGSQHLELVESLLERRADPNFEDATGTGQCTLIECIPKADVEVVSRLLAWGGNPTRRSSNGDSAILAACRSRRLDVLRLLVPQRADASTSSELEKQSSTLLANLETLQMKEIREYINRGVDINYRNAQGWTPLASAVFWGRRDLVECILRTPHITSKIKIQLNVQDAKGRTPLHIAARKGHDDLVRQLCNAKANVDAQDLEGWTPLHHAVFSSHSECVVELCGCYADVCVTDRLGITPFMLKDSPSRTCQPLSRKAVSSLEPVDATVFKQKLLPIISNESLTVFEKVEELMCLPGVASCFKNLRLHDQCFHLCRGPNTTRLSKLWENIGHELILRQRSGACDLDDGVQYNYSLFSSVGINTDDTAEIRRRHLQQRRFLEGWLSQTVGPPPSVEWTWDNREGYRVELVTCVKGEISELQAEAMRHRSKLIMEPYGEDLLQIPCKEVLRSDCLTQAAVHPILTWLDSTDALATLRALHGVKAFGGPGGHLDDRSLLAKMVDFVTANMSDFGTGAAFWQNVYKLWLSSYAKLADADLQAKLGKFVKVFNQEHAEEELYVTYESLPPRSYEALKQWERECGSSDSLQPGWRSLPERVTAAGCLDMLRSRMIANSPEAIVRLVDSLKQVGPHQERKERFEVVQIQNKFHDSASHDPLNGGCWEVVVNVLVHGGDQKMPACLGASTVPALSVKLVGEIRISLTAFHTAEERMKPLLQFLRGQYDSSPEGRPESGKAETQA